MQMGVMRFELTSKALANFSPGFLTPKVLANFSPGFLTPKALANFSPGFGAQRQPWGDIKPNHQTLKGFPSRRTLSGLCVCLGWFPGLSLALQPRAEIGQRLRR